MIDRTTARVRSWAVSAGALCLALAVVTIPFWDVVRGHATVMSFDVNDYYVPAHTAVWREIRSGHLPWWTPNVYAGTSAVGAGQYGVFYPFNALFGFLEPTNAHRWWFLAHLWLATCAMHAWSWHRWRSVPGAIVAAIAYTLGGWFVLHLQFMPFIAAVAWLPFVFLGVDLVRERWTTPRAALVAVPIALVGFAGHPQMVYYAALGLGLYVLVLALGQPGSRAWVVRVAGAIAFGFGMAALQLVPLLRYADISVRSSFGADVALTDRTLELRHLWLYPFPYLFGGAARDVFNTPYIGGSQFQEVGVFAGATVLALAALAVVRLRSDRCVLALVTVAVVATLLTLGDATPFGRLFFDYLPLADNFRAWSRAGFLPSAAIALLAGGGVAQLTIAPRRVLAGFAGASVALGVAALTVTHIGSMRPYLAAGAFSVSARAIPIAAVLALTVAVALLPDWRRGAMVAVVSVVALEVAFFASVGPWRGWSSPPWAAQAAHDPGIPLDFEPVVDEPGGIDRWFTDTYSYRMASLTHDLYGINAFDPLAPGDFAETVGGMTYDGFVTRPDFWADGWLPDVLRVTTLVLGDQLRPESDDWKRVGEVEWRKMLIWSRAPRLPEAYLAGAAEHASLEQIRRRLLDPNEDLEAHTYVEHRFAGLESLDRPGFVGEVIANDILDSGDVVVDAREDALLVLSHAWQPGWKATVDGHAAPVLRANGLVLGVPVPAGRHEVHLWFEPPGLRLGALVAVHSTAALFAVSPALAWWSRRRLVDSANRSDDAIAHDI